MVKRLIFFTVPMMLFLGFSSYAVVYSFFTDTATSTSNIFTAAAEFPSPTPCISCPIKINEIFEGSNSAEWVELFNPNNVPVLLNNLVIGDIAGEDTLPNLIIPANGFGVIVVSGSVVSVPISAITITIPNATIGAGLNGDGERLTLKYSDDTEIDSMSYGTVTSPFTLPAPGTTESLRRNVDGVDTDSAADWQLDNSPTIGTTNN